MTGTLPLVLGVVVVVVVIAAGVAVYAIRKHYGLTVSIGPKNPPRVPQSDPAGGVS